jgi:hypothetical protein
MPASNFHEYAQRIDEILDASVAAGEAVLINIQIDQRSSLRGFIAGVLQFNDDSELHFREFVDTDLLEPRLMYVYHHQDANRELIFRYDNASHRPSLPHAEHKHTPTGVCIHTAPTLAQVLDEVIRGMQS